MAGSGGGGEDHAGVRVPPPSYPLLTILLAVLMERVFPLGEVPVPGWLRLGLGGVTLVVALLVLGVWPLVLFHRSGQAPEPWRPSPELVAAGPYRLTRNPMYLLMVLACLVIGFMLGNLWAALLTPLCAAALHRFAILPEEAYLERRFGDGYRAYKRSVRRWI